MTWIDLRQLVLLTTPRQHYYRLLLGIFFAFQGIPSLFPDKYLGVTVVAGSKFSTSHLKPLVKFRSAANTVLNVHRKPSEQILMKLLYATFVSHLTYASDVIQYSVSQLQPLGVALNDCIRRIFTYNFYNKCESVRYLRLRLGYLSLTEIFENRSRSSSQDWVTLP